MRAYVVTDGEYSAYSIKGVFDSKEDAESYRTYHNYDNVEEFPMNPGHGGWPCGMLYRLDLRLRNGKGYIDRVGNNEGPLNWEYRDCGGKRCECRFYAKDEEHATKIAAGMVIALKAGSTLLTHRRTEQMTVADSDAPKSLKEYIESARDHRTKTKYISYVDTYRLNGLTLTLMHTKKEE